MPTLNNSIIKAVNNTLDQTVFTRHAFHTKHSSGGTIFKITFKENEEYFFEINKDHLNGDLKIKIAPGDILSSEEYTIKTSNEIFPYITDWVEYLKLNFNKDDEVDENNEEFLEKIDEYSEESFNLTNEDIKNIQNKIDDLYQELENIKEEKSISDHELSKIKSELENLKNSYNKMPNKTWLRSVGHKVYNISNKFLKTEGGQKTVSRITRTIIDEITQTCLPSS